MVLIPSVTIVPRSIAVLWSHLHSTTTTIILLKRVDHSTLYLVWDVILVHVWERGSGTVLYMQCSLYIELKGWIFVCMGLVYFFIVKHHATLQIILELYQCINRHLKETKLQTRVPFLDVSSLSDLSQEPASLRTTVSVEICNVILSFSLAFWKGFGWTH